MEVSTTAWLVVCVVLSAVVCPGTVAETQDTLVVKTEEGEVRGHREYTAKGRPFYAFYSIPYAKPPLGKLRFKDPVAHEGWEGVSEGPKNTPLCLQIPFIHLTKRQMELEGQEDCLFLSVHSHMSSNPNQKLPVMVFLHGGGFFAGGISGYKGNVLLEEDVVLVTVQYRLGVLGFLSTEDTVMPGNFGLKDQSLALAWVKRNIHHFGGDSNRVTLFGESAGGASVHYHLLSPYSRDLFTRGIMMSGTLLSPWARGGAHRNVAQYTAEVFGCPQSCQGEGREASEALLRCLQNVDGEALAFTLKDHVSLVFDPVLMGPRVDGDSIPSEPEILMSEGRHKAASVMSGVTADEGGLYALPLYYNKEMMNDLLSNFTIMGPAALELNAGDSNPVQLSRIIFQHYLGGVKADEQDADNLCKMFGDRHFNLGHDHVSASFSRNLGPNTTFLYSLNHRGQRSFDRMYEGVGVGAHWVNHVDDLYYLFTGGLMWVPLERDEDLKLRDFMVKLWVNFATYGHPTPDNSLGFIWEAAKPSHLHHLSLTPSPSMKPDSRKEIRKFWETLPIRENFLINPDKVVPLSMGETDSCSRRDTDSSATISTTMTTPTVDKRLLKYWPRD